jgi:hypothetical protein
MLLQASDQQAAASCASRCRTVLDANEPGAIQYGVPITVLRLLIVVASSADTPKSAS